MALASVVLAIVGMVIGIVFMIFGFFKRERNVGQVDNGTLRQDWARTGNIDFQAHSTEREPTSPSWLILRVEEKRIVESLTGQDITHLRWRAATVDEAKEVVVYWNSTKTDRNPERRSVMLKSA